MIEFKTPYINSYYSYLPTVMLEEMTKWKRMHRKYTLTNIINKLVDLANVCTRHNSKMFYNYNIKTK